MKRIMTLALFGLCACLVMACKNNNSSNSSDNSATDNANEKIAHSADPLRTRVENIYRDVCDTYNKANQMPLGEGMEMIGRRNFDREYCSAAWNKVRNQVTEKDSRLEGEMGFFDFDYWIMGQDFQDVSATDVKVQQINGDKATVTLTLHNCGNATPLTLAMVYERDNWFIDDFLTPGEGSTDSLRDDMNAYLNE